MNRITKRDVCLTVPDRWAQQYAKGKYADKVAIGEALNRMPVGDLTPDKIASVIGNESWTLLNCSECEHDSDEVVKAAGKLFCRHCLTRMVEVMQ